MGESSTRGYYLLRGERAHEANWRRMLHNAGRVFMRCSNCIMPKFLRHSNIEFYVIEEEILQNRSRSTTVGIDCHKSSYHVSFLHYLPRHEIIKRYCKFKVGQLDMERITDFLQALEQEFSTTIEIVMLESSGAYSRPLFVHLAKTWPLCMVNPAEFAKHGKKTDKYDAEKLALIGLQGVFQPSFLETNQENNIKQAARAAKKHRRLASMLSNSLGSLLIMNNIGFMRGAANITIMSKSGRQLIESILTGENVPAQVAMNATYYSKNPLLHERFLAIINSLAGVETLSPNIRSIIKDKYLSMLHHKQLYVDQLKKIQGELTHLMEDDFTGAQALELLKTIPSISLTSATIILSELGLRFQQRFGTPAEGGVDKMISYCGLNPSKQYSGDKQTSTRKAVMGNPHVRECLIECGQSLMKSTHQLGERYRALMRRNGGSGSAAGYRIPVAAAAKGLCKAIYWVIAKREAFNDSHYDYAQAVRSKAKRLERLMKDVKQVQEELTLEGSHEAQSILQQAVAKIAHDSYILMSPSPQKNLDLFDKRVQTSLRKAGIESIAEVWYYISSKTLQELKGIGEKTYRHIIDTLKAQRVIMEVR